MALGSISKRKYDVVIVGAGGSGMRASLEALYTVGSKVVDTLLADWPRYAKAPPK